MINIKDILCINEMMKTGTLRDKVSPVGYESFGQYMDAAEIQIRGERERNELHSDQEIGEVALVYICSYMLHRWNQVKTVYNFSEPFLMELARTEDTTVYKSIFDKLPFKAFAMNMPKGFDVEWCIVQIEPYKSDDGKVGIRITCFYSANGNYRYAQAKCMDGDSMIQQTLKEFATSAPDPESEDFDTFCDRQTIPYNVMLIAASACYYLASKNAEIKEDKKQKDNRIVIASAHGGKPKKVNVKTYNVGYHIGERFESQLKKHNAVTVSHIGSGTGSTKRPHVRRAHWHHYWTGAGRTTREVRWLEPMFILGDSAQDAVVHRVSGD